MNTVQAEWESFKAAAIPEDASPVQLREMKATFYAGALGMLSLMTGVAQTCSMDAAEKIADSVEEELELHLAQYLAERETEGRGVKGWPE